MERFLQDVRFAMRTLAKARSVTLAALATIALGIGAATAMFTVVNGVVLRPLAFPGSERVVILCETAARVGDYCIASPPNVEDWARGSRTVSAFGVSRRWPFILKDDADARGVSGAIATPGFFDVLQARAVVGRLFGPGDLTEGTNRVAVLSHALWRVRFGGDPAVVGREIVIDDRAVAVVGVLAEPPGIPDYEDVDVWMPLTAIGDDVTNREWRGFMAVGRLADGATLATARRELEVVRARLAEAYPDSNRDWGLRVLRLRDWVAGPVGSTLWLLFGAVGFVLLIGCANVANLLLVHASRRGSEFAVRAALGAARPRLVRLVLTESILLASAGGVLGLLVAAWATDAFLKFAPASLPRLDAVAIDWRVLAFATLVTAATAVVFGLAPALRASRTDLSVALKGTRQTDAAGGRLRRLLVISEIALALILLVGAGLLGRGFGRLLQWEPGFERDHLVPVWMSASPGEYPAGQQVVTVFEEVAREVAGLPGVAAAALTSAGPLFGGVETTTLEVDGRATAGEPPTVRWFDVGPGFFATLGVPLVRGRDFTDADGPDAVPVAIVNQALADRLMPGENPIGRRVTAYDQTLEIVGVVADVPPLRPDVPVASEIYWPKRQHPRWATFLLVRTQPDAGSVERAVRARAARVDPDLSIGGFMPLSEIFARRLVSPRFVLLLAALFAIVALVLSAIGTYGVMAFSVASRTREFGVRLALGAAPSALVRDVVGQGLRLAALGAAIGLAGAVLVARALGGLLYGVPPADPVAIAAAIVLFGAVALAACYVPARRASRVDPVVALRVE